MTKKQDNVKVDAPATTQKSTMAGGLRVRTAVRAGKVTIQDFHFVK